MEQLDNDIIIMVAVIASITMCAILYGSFLLWNCCRYLAARKKNRVYPILHENVINIEHAVAASAVKSYSIGMQLPQSTSLGSGWLGLDDLVVIDV